MSSTELVPGDYVLFPTNGGYTVECDAVLVEAMVRQAEVQSRKGAGSYGNFSTAEKPDSRASCYL